MPLLTTESVLANLVQSLQNESKFLKNIIMLKNFINVNKITIDFDYNERFDKRRNKKKMRKDLEEDDSLFSWTTKGLLKIKTLNALFW